jgi:cytochrome c oxidase subunit 1
MSFAATIFFCGLAIYTIFWGKRIGENPWGEGATTLEWTVSSPPAFHTFEELPVIKPSAHH